MNKDSRIYVAGHTGLVGSAIVRKLKAEGYENLILLPRKDLDLMNKKQVANFFEINKPEYVFMAAAYVGGVLANITYPAKFLSNNLEIQGNVMEMAHFFEVKKLLFLASNCIYPKLANQPLKEEYLFAGKLEPSTEAYAIAKLAGIKMCQAYRQEYGCNFISAIPVNIYGPNDRYNPENSHVVCALLWKFMIAKEKNLPSVDVWGSGRARREFMHSDDLADACLFLMNNYDDATPINVGPQQDMSIADLASMISEIVGYDGDIVFDYSKPDGILSKVLDTSRMRELGWQPKIKLRDGLAELHKSLSDK